MKAKPFRAVPPPSLEGRSAADVIRRSELVALIASRVPRGVGDDEAVVRNRVSSRVTSEVKVGRLVPSNEGFTLGDVRHWASLKWPTLFDDLPAHASEGAGVIELPGITASGTGYSLPGTLNDAHREILALSNRIEVLQRALEVERDRVRALEPDATKWRDWNRKKGRPRSR